MLGLQEVWQAKVRYVDGHTAQRPVVKNVWLRVRDRDSVFSAVVGPNRDTALIGAIVLEELDLLVDCVTQTLHPRDPNVIVTEIEQPRWRAGKSRLTASAAELRRKASLSHPESAPLEAWKTAGGRPLPPRSTRHCWESTRG